MVAAPWTAIHGRVIPLISSMKNNPPTPASKHLQSSQQPLHEAKEYIFFCRVIALNRIWSVQTSSLSWRQIGHIFFVTEHHHEQYLGWFQIHLSTCFTRFDGLDLGLSQYSLHAPFMAAKMTKFRRYQKLLLNNCQAT